MSQEYNIIMYLSGSEKIGGLIKWSQKLIGMF